jgi:Phosphate-selective porin O and P
VSLRCAAALGAGLLGLATPLPAQDSLLTELAQRFRSRPLSLGALLQVVGDYQDRDRASGVNGFRVTNFRLKLSGELDGGYGYLLQTNFSAAPAILDAELHYQVADALVFQAGQFKAPFSRELLTAAGDLDFVDRSRVVTALAPGRQLGAEVRGRLAGGRLEYAAGAFNGNGTGGRVNDDGRLLGAGRIGWWLLGQDAKAARRLEVGANVAYSHDTDVALGPLAASFQGRRTVWGADVRYSDSRWLVAGEIVGARLASADSGTSHPLGWQATAGYRPVAQLQLQLRWDALRPDGLSPDGDLLVLGLRSWPTGAVQFRLDDLIDVDHPEPARHRVQAGAQLGF